MRVTDQITRRALLRGFGTALTLPWLEAMVPDSAQAADAQRFPNRMAVIYVPNVDHAPDWTPKETGRDFTLPRIPQAARFRSRKTCWC